MRSLVAFAFATVFATAAAAQGKSGLDNPNVPIAPASTKQPANAVLDTTGIPGATDKAPEDSPVSAQHIGSALKVGSAVSMQLTAVVNSGEVKNGDAIHGTLTVPVKTSTGATLPAGTSVDGTVVSVAKAGTVQSAGVLSLQLTRVGNVAVVTDVVDFNGQEGHKDLPDSAPAKGTEAVAQTGATLDFHVLENGHVPGVVPGATLADTGGKKTTSHRKADEMPGLPSTGQPNTGPGVNQVPVNGGSQPAQNTAPTTGPKQ